MGTKNETHKSRCCPLCNRDSATDKGMGSLVPIPFGDEIQNDVDFNIKFPFPVDIIGIQSLETKALTANSVITLDIGGTNASTTHTITATAQGTHLRTAVNPNSDTLLRAIPANTAITIECDGTASAGEAWVYLEWRHA